MRRIHVNKYYKSKVWLNPSDGQPAVMRVTRIAQGVIYYRPYYGKHDDGSLWLGAAAYFPLSRVDHYLGEEVLHVKQEAPRG